MKRQITIKSVRSCISNYIAPAFLALATSSCSDVDPNTDPDTSPPIAQTPVAAQYPTDTENDDRPGLIVTGFDSDGLQDQASPYLLSTSTFRLASKTPGSGDAYIHMAVYDDAIPIATHINFYQPALDSCLLRELDEQPVSVSQSSHTSASGGQSLTINTSSGPWFTFNREQGDDAQSTYQVDNDLPGVLPIEANLSIPGDEFPTVAAYPLYEPKAPVRVKPDETQAITPSSEFTWLAGTTSNIIKINLLSYNSSDEFLGFAVTCWVEDDGQFKLPENITDFVEQTSHTLKVRYSRVYARLDWQDGIVIHQHLEVAE